MELTQDILIEIEIDRIKYGPCGGFFSFLHHDGPICEWIHNVMGRVNYILNEKPQAEIYTRLRHIIYLDVAKIPAITELKSLNDDYQAKLKLFDDDYWSKRKPLDDEILRYIRLEIPDCGWDGKTIFGKKDVNPR